MRLFLLGFAALALHAPSPAQSFEPLRSEGPLHADFTRPATERFREREVRGPARGRDARRERDLRNDFALTTSVALDRQHRSGQILSGDWVSRLVEALGQRVVAASSLADGEPVRFYVVASPAVNAFATPDRTVYVTMGLLARIESEAQLALVLAHELGHVRHDHSIDLHLEQADYAEEQRSLRRRERDDDPFAVNRFSRANEIEADDYGFDLYRELGYAGADALAAFALLRDSDLPFADYRLAAGDLAALGLRPAEEHLLDSLVSPDRYDDDLDEDEELTAEERAERRAAASTHPALEDRLAEAEGRLGDLGGHRFRVWSEAEYQALRRQARYETADYLLRDFANPEAAQAALALLATDPRPDTAFLRRTLVQAQVNYVTLRQLHAGIAAELREEASGRRASAYARRRYEEFEPFPGASKGLGEVQPFYHLFAEAPVEELANSVLAQALALERDYPDLASARALTDRAVEVVQTVRPRSYDNWARDVPGAATLPDELDLERRFRAARDFTDLEEWNREDGDRIRQTARRGPEEAVTDLTVLAPQYSYGDGRILTSAEETVAREEVGERVQLDLIRAEMAGSGVRGEVISDRLATGDAAALNDLRTGNEWLRQFIGLESLRLIPHNHDRLLAMLAEHDTEHLAYLTEQDARLGGLARGFLVYADLPYLVLSPFDGLASLASRRHVRTYGQFVVHPASRTITVSRPVTAFTRQGDVHRRGVTHQFFANLATPSRAVTGHVGRRHVAEVGLDVRLLRWTGEYETANNTPGLRLAYRYAAGRRVSLGATARFAGYTATGRAGTAESELAFRSTHLTAELEWHGRQAVGRMAPTGLFYTLGVGTASLSSDVAAARVAASADSSVEAIPDGRAQFVTLGAGYRYIVAERFAVTPFARVNVGGHGLQFGLDSYYRTVSEALQTGVRVGLLW